MGLAKTVMRPIFKTTAEGLSPRVVPESKPFVNDTVTVGLGSVAFRAPSSLVEIAVKGVSEGLGVASGTLAGAATTALALAFYPAAAVSVGTATAAACLMADVEGDNALHRGAKKLALAAALAPTAALLAPAVLGTMVAVATEELVTQTSEWGINSYMVSDSNPNLVSA